MLLGHETLNYAALLTVNLKVLNECLQSMYS